MNFIIFASLVIMVSSQTVSNQSACSNPQAFGFFQRPGTKLYHRIADILLNWFEAEAYCQKYGAHLPSVLNSQDNDYLRSLIGSVVLIDTVNFNMQKVGNFGGYWLGGYRSILTNQWKWSDDNPFVYKNWATGEPNYPISLLEEYFTAELYSTKDFKYVGWHDSPKNMDRVVVCQLNCS